MRRARRRLRSGRKSLLVNSVDLCRGRHRATVAMDAHNGHGSELRPVVRAGCGGRR